MRKFAPAGTAGKLLEFWDECDGLLKLAEGTPKGICHLDCHNKNLFPIERSIENSYTVGIDWVKVGISNLGIDIGHVLASSLTWIENTSDQDRSLRDPIFDAYMSGLASEGWSGNADEVRLVYLTRLSCEAIRHTNLLFLAIENPKWGALMESFTGLSLSKISTRFGENLEFYFDCREEAVQLAK